MEIIGIVALLLVLMLGVMTPDDPERNRVLDTVAGILKLISGMVLFWLAVIYAGSISKSTVITPISQSISGIY